MFTSNARQVPRIDDPCGISPEESIEAFSSLRTVYSDEIEQIDAEANMRIVMAVAVVLFAVVSADAQRGPSPEVGDLIYRPLEVAPTPPVLQKACWEDHIKEAE